MTLTIVALSLVILLLSILVLAVAWIYEAQLAKAQYEAAEREEIIAILRRIVQGQAEEFRNLRQANYDLTRRAMAWPELEQVQYNVASWRN